MKTIEEIKYDLLGIEGDVQEIEEQILESFEDYEFEGEAEIIISKDESTEYDYQIYANHINAPIIGIKIENNMIVDSTIL